MWKNILNQQKSKQSWVFDLDGTICIPNHQYSDTERRYAQATPNHGMINHLQGLHKFGDYIIIHTARRMLTHNGNLYEIIEDVGQVTRDWLKQYEVPYNELIFGKPYAAHYYVDDKAMKIIDFENYMSDRYVSEQ